MLEEYGIVEQGSRAFGCNKTGAMKDFIFDGNAVITSAVQRVLYQLLYEKYGGPPWTHETLPGIVLNWLDEEGLSREKILAYKSERGESMTKVIHTEMARLGSKVGGSLKREMSIQNALRDALYRSWELGNWDHGL